MNLRRRRDDDLPEAVPILTRVREAVVELKQATEELRSMSEKVQDEARSIEESDDRRRD